MKVCGLVVLEYSSLPYDWCASKSLTSTLITQPAELKEEITEMIAG